MVKLLKLLPKLRKGRGSLVALKKLPKDLEDSAKTLETLQSPSQRSLLSCCSDDCESEDSLSEMFHERLRTRPAHPHRRSRAMMEDEFQQLYVKSRGWAFDPNEPASRPTHDRRRNRAFTEFEFDQFIFTYYQKKDCDSSLSQ